MSVSPSHPFALSCEDLNASAQRKVLSSSSVNSKSCSWYFYSTRVVHTVATHRFCYSPWTVGCTAVGLEVSAVCFHPGWQSFVMLQGAGGGVLNSNCCLSSVGATHVCGTQLVTKKITVHAAIMTIHIWCHTSIFLLFLFSSLLETLILCAAHPEDSLLAQRFLKILCFDEPD